MPKACYYVTNVQSERSLSWKGVRLNVRGNIYCRTCTGLCLSLSVCLCRCLFVCVRELYYILYVLINVVVDVVMFQRCRCSESLRKSTSEGMLFPAKRFRNEETAWLSSAEFNSEILFPVVDNNVRVLMNYYMWM